MDVIFALSYPDPEKPLKIYKNFCILAEKDTPAALLPIFVDHPRINEN